MSAVSFYSKKISKKLKELMENKFSNERDRAFNCSAKSENYDCQRQFRSQLRLFLRYDAHVLSNINKTSCLKEKSICKPK